MTTAVGDSIRSKTGKPKKRKPIKRSEEKTCRAADHGSADEPCVRIAQPPAAIMEIQPRGRRGAKAVAAARSRTKFRLIPCRTIERGMVKYDDILWSLMGEYI